MMIFEFIAVGVISILLMIMINNRQGRPDKSKAHAEVKTTRVMMAAVQFFYVSMRRAIHSSKMVRNRICQLSTTAQYDRIVPRGWWIAHPYRFNESARKSIIAPFYSSMMASYS
jgi:hypothetical protein